MADLNKDLHEAVVRGDINSVEKLLVKGADPNSQEYSPAREKVPTILQVAVGTLNVDVHVVRLLLQYGGDPNLEDGQKITPIFTAGIMRPELAPEIVQLLLQYGADVHHTDKLNRTAIPVLIQQGLLPYDQLTKHLDVITNVTQPAGVVDGNLLHLIDDIHPEEEEINNEFDDSGHFCEDFIERLCGKGVSVNMTDAAGDTPLHTAASCACPQAIKALLNLGAHVNARNFDNQTPLFVLAEALGRQGFEDSFKHLLDNGAEINATDFFGKTPLHEAVKYGDIDTVTIRKYVDHGARLDIVDELGKNLIFSFTDIEDCRRTNHELSKACLKFLIDAGLDINGADHFLLTPLLNLSLMKDVNLFRMVLESGADILQTSKTGESSLHRATARYMLWPLIEELCLHKNDIDVNVKDTFGSTPLHWAIWFREQTAIKSLLKLGADISIANSSGHTAMDLAKVLKFDMFQLLMERPEGTKNIVMSADGFEMEYHGHDILEECPVMKYVDMVDTVPDVSDWKEHLQCHEASLKAFIKNLMEVTTMGHFYDLEENELIPQVIESLMNELAQHVTKTDPLMACSVRLAGSRFEGTKVETPNEFDYLFSLDEFSKCFVPVDTDDIPDEYIKLRLSHEEDRERFAKYIDDSGFLDGTKVNRHLYRIFNEGLLNTLKERSRMEYVNLYPVNVLGITFGTLSNLQLVWTGSVMKCLQISVDVVPEIILDGWLPRSFEQGRLLLKNIDHQQKSSVVLKTADPNYVADHSKHFRLSFASWEQGIIHDVPEVVKKGYITVKALLSSNYYPDLVSEDGAHIDLLTTYKLKTCFLHELEKAAQSGDPTLKLNSTDKNSDVSLDWAARIVNHLDTAVAERCLPSFFSPGRNLLQFSGSNDVFNTCQYEACVSCLKLLLGTGSK